MHKWIALLCTVLGFESVRAGQLAPDFKLYDTNPNSARSGATVSPRDYLLQVSGYYFGDAG